MIRLLAIRDAKGWPVPLFEDNRINRAIVSLADHIIARRTHVPRFLRRYPANEGLDEHEMD